MIAKRRVGRLRREGIGRHREAGKCFVGWVVGPGRRVAPDCFGTGCFVEGRCWGSFGLAEMCLQEVVGRRAVNWAVNWVVKIAGSMAVGLTVNWVGMAAVGSVDCWWLRVAGIPVGVVQRIEGWVESFVVGWAESLVGRLVATLAEPLIACLVGRLAVNLVVLPAVNLVVLLAVNLVGRLAVNLVGRLVENPVVFPVEMLVELGGQWLWGRHSIRFFRPLRSPNRVG